VSFSPFDLPDGATVNRALLEAVAEECLTVDSSPTAQPLWRVSKLIDDRARGTTDYDAAALLACALLMSRADVLLQRAPADLLRFINRLGTAEQARTIARRLRRDRNPYLRRTAQAILARHGEAEGSYLAPRVPLKSRRLSRHPSGQAAQKATGVPPLSTVADMRQLLEIPTQGQLRYLLSDNGWFSFTIKKSDGSDRTIDAPSRQLRAAQRNILRRETFERFDQRAIATAQLLHAT